MATRVESKAVVSDPVVFNEEEVISRPDKFRYERVQTACTVPRCMLKLAILTMDVRSPST